MPITCTNCETSYQIAPSSLGATGRSVRCARCGYVWFGANTGAMAEIAESHRDDVAAWAETAVAPEHAGVAAESPLDAPAEPEPEGGDLRAADSTGSPTGATLPDAAAPAPGPPAGAPAMCLGTNAPAPAVPLAEDIETVTARRARQQAAKRRRWHASGWSTAILALTAVNLALVGWRADVVRWLPQTASLYAAIGLPVNLRGLVFTNITTEKETQEGVPVLVADGAIVNDSKRSVDVPGLRFAVRDQDGHEIYTWTAPPARNALLPGETLPFRTRLASPPRDGQQVLVRFFNSRDLAAGIQ